MEVSSFGDRMKSYENQYEQRLEKRTPVIIRVDGRSFSNYTKKLQKPYCFELHSAFVNTTENTLRSLDNVVFAYTQSDEISFLLRDWDREETQALFDYRVQKLCSVFASVFCNYFKEEVSNLLPGHDLPVSFDARAFNVPMDDVDNYFIWRQKDCIRNSVNMLGQSLFKQKELNGKKVQDVKEMILTAGQDWDAVAGWAKHGSCVYMNPEGRGSISDIHIPVFTSDRDYINRHVYLSNSV